MNFLSKIGLRGAEYMPFVSKFLICMAVLSKNEKNQVLFLAALSVI